MSEVLMNGNVAITVAYANGDKHIFETGQWVVELIGHRVVVSKFNDGTLTHLVVFPEDSLVSVSLEGRSG